jgi:DNA-binding NtrC family response regulator
VHHFVTRFSAEEKKRQLVGATPDALALLQAHDWPGNIRQLENAVFRAVVLADGSHLTIDEFPQIAAQVGTPPKASPIPASSPNSFAATVNSTVRELQSIAVTASSQSITNATSMSQWSPAASGFTSGSGPAPFGFLRSLDEKGHVMRLAAIEEEMIRIAIEHYGGRMSEVARRLGIGRSTLYRKLKEYGLDDSLDFEAAG